MGTIFAIIVGLAIVGWLIDAVKPADTSGRETPPRRPRPHRPSRQPTQPPNAYRPTTRGRRASGIQFNDVSAGSSSAPTADSLEGIRDAFTGAPLDPKLGLYRCSKCQVYYHRESFEVVAAENGGRCVACSSATIIQVSSQSAPGRNFTPDVVTLANFRQHFGRVVTFEGVVRVVRVSQRGTDFAVMFEQKSWVTGFKLVFFRQAVRKVGGAPFVRNLEGRRVRVRGLLINHEQFGPEIIISERSMILDIK